VSKARDDYAFSREEYGTNLQGKLRRGDLFQENKFRDVG
jgi:hypothetical protein